MKKNLQNNIVFIPLGGTGEIGMNMNLYGIGHPSKRDWIMVDIGITFPQEKDVGIDIIMPDIEFILPYIKQLKGLILTHGHEDHIGAIAHLWSKLRCPIYATPFTAELVKEKFRHINREESLPLQIVPLNTSIDLDSFNIEFISLTHSIAESNALAIRTEFGNILHTGDWKIDPNPQIGDRIDTEKLIAFGKEGVDTIVCDSTNVLSKGSSGSENIATKNLYKVIMEARRKVIVTSFASNVARMSCIGDAAIASHRQMLLLGRGVHRIYNAAKKTGYLKKFPPLINEEIAKTIPSEQLIVLCTGSQGETRAVLSRLAYNTYPSLQLEAGDTVIFSSKMIPGNENAVFSLQNQLARLKVKIITNNEDNIIHVSGHPNEDELIQMYQWIKPRTSIPVHGEDRHLFSHVNLAKSLGVDNAIHATNGDMIKLLPGRAEIIGHVASGRLYLDGKVLIPEQETVTKIRRKLSYHGVITLSLAIDRADRVASMPKMTLLGIPNINIGERTLKDLLIDEVDMCIPDNAHINSEKLKTKIIQKISRIVSQYWGKKTEIVVHLITI